MKKKQEILLDYVASGFSASFRLASPHEDFEAGISKHLEKSSEYLKQKLGNVVKISGLFNAYTEEMYANRVEASGQPFQKLFPDGMYADSGGLQVVTQGKEITEKQRKKIYEVQAKYADYAMSFDEIPAEMIITEDANGEIKKERCNFEDPEKIRESGLKAGDNLKEQIKYFKKIGSSTKVFPIIQGVGNEDMTAYTEGLLSKLTDDELNDLECLAVGNIDSEFELVERAVNIYDLDFIPGKLKSHFHALGVTGFRKLLPIVLAARNGLLPGLKKLSFDSTTFTKSYILGNVQPSLEDYKRGRATPKGLGRKRNDMIDAYYQEMFDWWKDNPDNIFENVEDLIQHSCYHGQFNDPNKPDLPLNERYTTGKQQYSALSLEDGVKTIVQKHVYIYYNTYKFITILEAYLNGEIELGLILDGYKQLDLLKWLEKITDIDELDEFLQEAQKTAKMARKTVSNGNEKTEWMFDEKEEVKEETSKKKNIKKKAPAKEIDSHETASTLF